MWAFIASCYFAINAQVGSHSIDTFVGGRAVGERVLQRVVDPVNAVQLVSEVKKEVVSERAEHKILIVSGLEEEVDVTVRGNCYMFPRHKWSLFICENYSDRDRNVQAVTLAKVSDTLWTASWIPKVIFFS